MLFLLLGALDLGRVFYTKIAVTDAAKEGALVASQKKTTSEIVAAVVSEAKGGFVEIDAANVTAAECPSNPDGTTPPIPVTVEAPFHALTPFVAGVLGGDDVMIGATATARCRYTPPFPGTPAPTPSPTPTPTPPACPAASFAATDTHNAGHPHRMRLDGAISPSSGGWTWTWTGAFSDTGQTITHDFSASGPVSLTLTVSKGTCSVSVTQTVAAP
jgi:Flp pilus assembly protein TadG